MMMQMPGESCLPLRSSLDRAQHAWAQCWRSDAHLLRCAPHHAPRLDMQHVYGHAWAAERRRCPQQVWQKRNHDHAHQSLTWVRSSGGSTHAVWKKRSWALWLPSFTSSVPAAGAGWSWHTGGRPRCQAARTRPQCNSAFPPLATSTQRRRAPQRASTGAPGRQQHHTLSGSHAVNVRGSGLSVLPMLTLLAALLRASNQRGSQGVAAWVAIGVATGAATGTANGRACARARADVHHVDQALDARDAAAAGRLVCVQPGAARQRHAARRGRRRRHVDGVEAAEQPVVAPQVCEDLHAPQSMHVACWASPTCAPQQAGFCR